MPVRALGAPQTTCTGLSPPISTKQMRSRPALGCGFASTISATTKPLETRRDHAHARPRGRSCSGSRRSSASLASVSRWCLSQDRVNFIAIPVAASRPNPLRRRFGEAGLPASIQQIDGEFQPATNSGTAPFGEMAGLAIADEIGGRQSLEGFGLIPRPAKVRRSAEASAETTLSWRSKFDLIGRE